MSVTDWLHREWQRLINRCTYSWQGLVHIWQSEPSFVFWTCVNIAFGILAFVLPLSGAERGVVLGLGIAILAAECLNTGIERLVDMTGPEHTDMGKQAKDAASAGVALMAVAAGVAWLCVLIW